MPRPPVEVADIIRAAGESFFEDSRKWLTWLHLKVLNAILRCRTAALGGHVDACSKCGHEAISFNSCRNRHCPKCQANARDRWLEARGKELLPTRYVHVVFTLPRRLSPLALQNKREIYALLFRASAETLLEISRDPKHLGAEIGFFSVLHTWNQKLQHHPHVHCVVPAGGLAPDHLRWIDSQRKFFLPVDVLKEVFRGKFTEGLRELHAEGKLGFHGTLAALQNRKAFAAWLRPLFRSPWVVYAKRPFGGAQHALRYLGQYTHRVAISNHRLVGLSDGVVTFRWRDSAHKNKKRLMTLPVNEFLRRFLLHVLPPGFVRIRHFGLMAHRRRGASLPLCLQLLAQSGPVPAEAGSEEKAVSSPPPLWTCPQCGAPMVLIERLSPIELRLRSPPMPAAQPR
jgi:predicted Zn-ribbon and HTH transcriptional regulator